jgi:DNA-binding MarR family transcriptional regulator
MARDELSIVDGLAQLSFLIHGTLERRASEHELSMIQMRLLGVLRDRTPTMNELAQLLGLDKSSVTGLVDRAERRGFVRRVASMSDGRAVLVKLTATGRRIASKVATQFQTDVTELVKALPTAERKVLSGLVSRLLVSEAASRGVDLFPTASSRRGSRSARGSA